MAIPLERDVINLINSPTTLKALGTVTKDGVPHLVIKDSFWVNDEGQLLYLEFLESSQTNQNMIASLWFDRQVSVLLLGADRTSYQIKGRPIKVLVAGPVFREQYERIRRQPGDRDLAGVWIIEPEAIIDQALAVRRKTEENSHPYFMHLDRIAKK